MAEIWGAAIALGGAVVSGIAAEKKAKAERKANREDTSAMTQEESELAAQRTGYELALEDFYVQKERVGRQRGLDQFRQFSSLGTYAPEYTGDTRIQDPVMPQYNDFDPSPEEDVLSNEGKGGGGKSLFEKRKDLHFKPLKKLGDLF